MLILLCSAGSLELVEVSVKEKVLMLLQHPARAIYPGKLWFTNHKPKCFCPVRLQEFLFFNISWKNESICYSFWMEVIFKDRWNLTLPLLVQYDQAFPATPKTCLDLPELLLVYSGNNVMLKIVLNERLLNFSGNKTIAFPIWYATVEVIGKSEVSSSKIGGFFGRQYLWKQSRS